MSAFLGLAMFTQFRYWYPLIHIIGLNINNADLIRLNKDLNISKLPVQCNANEHLYGYVPFGPLETTKEVPVAPKAVLSVTVKTVRRAQKKKSSEAFNAKAYADDKMSDATHAAASHSTNKSCSSTSYKMDTATEGSGSGTGKEMPYWILRNTCRFLGQHKQYLSGNLCRHANSRYTGVLHGRLNGIAFMTDKCPRQNVCRLFCTSCACQRDCQHRHEIGRRYASREMKVQLVRLRS